MEGYSRRCVRFDCTNKKYRVEELSEEFCTDWIGGIGFGTKIMWDEIPRGADPLGPDNVLIFSIGPFPATFLPTSSKYAVMAKSPATGLWGMAISSGSVGQQMARAGYQMLIFKGKFPEPTYVFLDDDEISLIPCGEGSDLPLWGKGCWTVEEELKEYYCDQRLAIASIGPAGEGGETGKPSAIGCITNDRNRQAGRTGMGGVMGSKMLKAIVARGTGSIRVAKPKEFYDKCKVLLERVKGPACQKYRDLGTPSGLLPYSKLGMIGVRNNQEGTLPEHASNFSGEYLNEKYVVKKAACSQCSVACDHLAMVPLDHPHWPGVVASVDIENCYSMGSNCGIFEFPPVIKGISIADDLGMDAISAGCTVAFAMECFERGLIKEEDLGFDLSFGNQLGLVRMLEEMGRRSSKIGDLLADGVRKAAERLGGDAHKYAMHVKGLEFPMFDVHGMSSFAVGVSVSLRGACHLRNGAYGLDAKGNFDRFGWDKPLERGRAIMEVEDEYAIIDSLIVCKFTRGIYEKKTDYVEVYEMVTGYPMTVEHLWLDAERINNLAKCFNLREGATKADDFPPDRFFTEAPTYGSTKGVTLDRKGFQRVLEGYYQARGWDSEGVPTEETLARLGLDKMVDRKMLTGGK
ncbi:MAG: aldehyde ferredoxin oxidoreductase family protein [Promethearchaeota archaeon]